MARKKKKQVLKRSPEEHAFLGSWKFTLDDVRSGAIGDINMDEHLPFCRIMPDSDVVKNMLKIIRPNVANIQSRIERRLHKQLRAYMCGIGASQKLKQIDDFIDPIVQARTVDEIARNHISKPIAIDEVNDFMVLPMMTILAKSPNIIHKIFAHPNYESTAERGTVEHAKHRDRRNEFICALCCEQFGATLFSVTPETPFTPALVAVLVNSNTHNSFFKDPMPYPMRGTDEENEQLINIMKY